MHDALTVLFGEKLPTPIRGALQKLLVLDRFNQLFDEVRRRSEGQPFLELFLATLHVRPSVSDADLAWSQRVVRWWRLRIIRSAWWKAQCWRRCWARCARM
jgi:hypothetical protein